MQRLSYADSGKEGEGIIVWDKKVIPFSARIEKDNPLYEPYNTNFHEKAKRKEEQIRMEAERKKQMETGVPQKKRKQEVEAVSGYGKILQLAELTEICGKDVENLLHLSAQQAEQILKKMKEEQLLIESPDKNGFIGKQGDTHEDFEVERKGVPNGGYRHSDIQPRRRICGTECESAEHGK